MQAGTYDMVRTYHASGVHSFSSGVYSYSRCRIPFPSPHAQNVFFTHTCTARTHAHIEPNLVPAWAELEEEGGVGVGEEEEDNHTHDAASGFMKAVSGWFGGSMGLRRVTAGGVPTQGGRAVARAIRVDRRKQEQRKEGEAGRETMRPNVERSGRTGAATSCEHPRPE